MAITIPAPPEPTTTISPKPDEDLALSKAHAGYPLTHEQKRLVVLHVARRHYELCITEMPGCDAVLLERALGTTVCESSDEWARLVQAVEDLSRVEDDVDDVRFTYDPPPSRDWMFERVGSDLDAAVDLLLAVSA